MNIISIITLIFATLIFIILVTFLIYQIRKNKTLSNTLEKIIEINNTNIARLQESNKEIFGMTEKYMAQQTKEMHEGIAISQNISKNMESSFANALKDMKSDNKELLGQVQNETIKIETLFGKAMKDIEQEHKELLKAITDPLDI